ncbi:MAG: hypothetical protein LBI02_01960, partial [Opitutaceae bacterium]|nr:hypothetical protein [Opitutaceae bacterium]
LGLSLGGGAARQVAPSKAARARRTPKTGLAGPLDGGRVTSVHKKIEAFSRRPRRGLPTASGHFSKRPFFFPLYHYRSLSSFSFSPGGASQKGKKKIKRKEERRKKNEERERERKRRTRKAGGGALV